MEGSKSRGVQMDALLVFEEEWLPVDEHEAGPGIDALLGAGMDERRLHLRAHERWMAAREGDACPPLDRLQEADGEFAPFSLILDFCGDAPEPTVRHVGHRLRATLGSPAGGPLLARLAAHYPMIAESGMPVGFEAELASGHGGSTLYRGMLMPVAIDGAERPSLYGVINSRNLADSHAMLSLALEVDQALPETNGSGSENPWEVRSDAEARLNPIFA